MPPQQQQYGATMGGGAGGGVDDLLNTLDLGALQIDEYAQFITKLPPVSKLHYLNFSHEI
jgi:hypothetical protein